MNSLAQALIITGLILLLLSLKPAFSISQLPTEQQQGWRILLGLIFAFITGYFGYLYMLSDHPVTQLEMVVALVFCGGGGFVYIITRMSEKTIHVLVSQANRHLHQAHHDPLTRLPNRIVFYKKLSQISQDNQIFCCLILDLNDFKKINDTHGHNCGDKVLKSVAERIRSCLPEHAVAARLGGDELGILLFGSFASHGQVFVEQLHGLISQPINYQQHIIHIGVSIGIAEYPHHGSHRKQLLNHADIAMYQAKRNKKPYCLYEANFSTANKNTSN
ncbi:GGDEF domain-containing protein [Shewanella sp. SR44-3]|uniref:GGDEF domain-containing protein n=1 Tax=unclassified Shewanella TaxID=196818 RepID=UPI0015FDB000|nr:GGDEF domain-containing protein [Shewanella sp. SR44-3]MBB1270036.1 GGDEF domain-containing protein [Shewanella sp. SR44-3]